MPRAPVAPLAPHAPTCPRCGGAVTVSRDAHGYGAVIEQCAQVLRCGYLMTLEWPRIPAHTKVRKTARAETFRRGSAPGSVRTALLAAVPTTKAHALSAAAIAEIAGRERATTATRLGQMATAGEILVVTLTSAAGEYSRPRRAYWRRA